MKPIERLKRQYKNNKFIENMELPLSDKIKLISNSRQIYKSMRMFCLDCSLLSLLEIKEMESNVDKIKL